MNDLQRLSDSELLDEINRRFDEKSNSLNELEFLNKKLLELNNQLVEMDSVKSKFLSLIKNEFNNPISSVLNLCGHLISKKRPERFDEIVAMIHMEVLRLDFQIKNIISASELEAGETSNYFTRVNFNTIFEDVKRSFDYIINDKNLVLNFENNLQDSVCSDSNKLYLILLNLLSNACEYSYAWGTIDTKIFLEDENIVIQVSDIGEGIVVENKMLIYNRFTQFSRDINRGKSGLGLGLSVVKGMVEALDGNVDYYSVPDVKTTFTVRIPKSSENDAGSLMGSGANDMLFEDFDDAMEL